MNGTWWKPPMSCVQWVSTLAAVAVEYTSHASVSKATAVSPEPTWGVAVVCDGGEHTNPR